MKAIETGFLVNVGEREYGYREPDSQAKDIHGRKAGVFHQGSVGRCRVMTNKGPSTGNCPEQGSRAPLFPPIHPRIGVIRVIKRSKRCGSRTERLFDAVTPSFQGRDMVPDMSLDFQQVLARISRAVIELCEPGGEGGFEVEHGRWAMRSCTEIQDEGREGWNSAVQSVWRTPMMTRHSSFWVSRAA